jgi:hypothetical protein
MTIKTQTTARTASAITKTSTATATATKTSIDAGWNTIVKDQSLSVLFLDAYSEVCGKPRTKAEWIVADDIFDAITRKVYHARLNVVVREFQLTKTGRGVQVTHHTATV